MTFAMVSSPSSDLVTLPTEVGKHTTHECEQPVEERAFVKIQNRSTILPVAVR